MKLDQLFGKIKPMQKFINTMDLNQQGYYYIEEGSSTVRYVAYEGCPASTIQYYQTHKEKMREYQRKYHQRKKMDKSNDSKNVAV